MTRWLRIFSPLFIASLLVFVGDAVSLALIRATVLSCTVGFRTSGLPLGAGQAAQCPSFEIGAGILVAIGLVAGAGLLWLAWKFFKAHAVGPPQNASRELGREAETRASRGGILSRLRSWPTIRWVCLLAALFFVASFFAASWQYLHLVPFDNDVAINQQVLSSTLQGGKPYQFYEAFNCGQHGQCSYLEVHQAFFGYVIALPFGVSPTPYTLFAIQSLALSLAALPLYALAVDVIGSRRLSLVVAAAYLAWLPLLIISTRDTFNWEAFIPVELLTVFWLWNRQRYLLAIPVVLVTFLTYEVNTVLVFFVGLYFLWPSLVKAVRLFFHAVFTRSAGPSSSPSKLRLWGRWIWKTLHLPQVYASIALMVASLVAYVLLRLFVLDGGWLLGIPPVPPAYALPINSPNVVFVFTFHALSDLWLAKLWFWIVVFLTLGFVPLFAPRALILLIPWFVLADFNITQTFWNFNGHYALPPAAALFIAFTFGLNTLYRWVSAILARTTTDPGTAVGPSGGVPGDERTVRTARHRPWTLNGSTASASSRAAGMLSVGIVVVIAGNLFLSPLDPLAASFVPNLGNPFPPTYGLATGPASDIQYLQQLVSIIPRNAVVTAPVSVYPWVADDPYAYPMQPSPYNVTVLPDHESSRLGYVLLPYNTPDGSFYSAPLGSLYDPSDFAVRACVSSSAVGGVELFQRNYTGTPTVFGPPGPLCPNYFSGSTGLTPGPDAYSSSNASSPSGEVVSSTACAKNGLVWTGPGIELPSGRYRFHLVFNVINTTGTHCQKPNPKGTLLTVNVTGENASESAPTSITRHQFSVSQVCLPAPACGDWYYWNETITLPSLTSDFSISGTVLLGQYIVQVSYLVLSPYQS